MVLSAKCQALFAKPHARELQRTIEFEMELIDWLPQDVERQRCLEVQGRSHDGVVGRLTNGHERLDPLLWLCRRGMQRKLRVAAKINRPAALLGKLFRWLAARDQPCIDGQ